MFGFLKNLFSVPTPETEVQSQSQAHTVSKPLPDWYVKFMEVESYEEQIPLFDRPTREHWLEFTSDADLIARPLVPPGSSSLKLFARITDENTSPKEAGEMVADDPILTARILKTVNSAYFGLSVPVNDVQTAVNLLGLDQLKILIMTQAVESHTRPDSGLERIALHSAIVGQIAGMLGARFKRSVPVMQTLGVLHDMGRLLRPYVKKTNSHFLTIHEELQHGLLGGAFARIWNLPHALSNVLENLPFSSYGHDADVVADNPRDIYILALAQFLANAFGFCDSTKVRMPSEAIRDLGIDPDPRTWLTEQQIHEIHKTTLLF